MTVDTNRCKRCLRTRPAICDDWVADARGVWPPIGPVCSVAVRQSGQKAVRATHSDRPEGVQIACGAGGDGETAGRQTAAVPGLPRRVPADRAAVRLRPARPRPRPVRGEREAGSTAAAPSSTPPRPLLSGGRRRQTRLSGYLLSPGRVSSCVYKVFTATGKPVFTLVKAVRAEGLEPSSSFEQWHLKPSRLPISPRPRLADRIACDTGELPARARRIRRARFVSGTVKGCPLRIVAGPRSSRW
jgi:hypothetical protein